MAVSLQEATYIVADFSGPTLAFTGFADLDTAQADALGNTQARVIIEAATSEFVVAEGMLLQTALSAAQPGSTIKVMPGVYDASVIVDKAITIQGSSAGEVIMTSSQGSSLAGMDSAINIVGNLGEDAAVSISGISFVGAAYGAGVGFIGHYTLEPDVIEQSVLGSLSVDDCVFSGNANGGLSAGTLHNDRNIALDNLSVTNSSFSNNGSSQTADIGLNNFYGDAVLQGLTISGEGSAAAGIGLVTTNGAAMGDVAIEDVNIEGIYLNSGLLVSGYDDFSGLDTNKTNISLIPTMELGAYSAVSLSGIGSDYTLDGVSINPLYNFNTIEGTDADQALTGGDDVDIITAGGGNDILDGGLSSDLLEGGAGNDIFVGRTNSGLSIVQDFTIGEDKIDLTKFYFNNSIHFSAINQDVSGGNILITFANSEASFQLNGGIFGAPLTADTFIGLTTHLGTQSDDQLTGSEWDDIIDGQAGDDHIGAGSGNDLLYGGSGHDFLLGRNGDDEIHGGTGDDTILAGAGNDTLIGGAGADVFRFGDEDGVNTIVDFAPGEDLINLRQSSIQSFSEVRQKVDGNDLVISFANTTVILKNTAAVHGLLTAQDFLTNVNDITGTNGDDVLAGTSGKDNITGLDGDDILDSRASDDVMTGGEGQDVFVVRHNSGHDTITDFVLGQDKIDLSATDVASFERISQEISGADLILTFDGIDAQLTLQNAAASGSLSATSFIGITTHLGTEGDDQLRGSTGDDVMSGLAGDDHMGADAGDDILYGGTGNDFMVARAGDDEIYGEEGNDTILAGAGNDTITGGAGADQYRFGSDDGVNTITDFTRGEDILNFRPAGVLLLSDVEQSIVGDDIVLTVDNTTVILENAAADGLLGIENFWGMREVRGTSGDDQLDGTYAPDTIRGLAGNDTITGGQENDTLDGGEGDDILTDGAGSDTLIGGEGADLFIFEEDDSIDTITDFVRGEDLIDVSAYGVQLFSDIQQEQYNKDIILTIAGKTIVLQNAMENGFLDATDFEGIISHQGTEGADAILGSFGNDVIMGLGGDDHLSGNQDGNDVIHGGDGNDLLINHDGNSKLYGDAGDDSFVDGAGDDEMTGGTGADTFRFAADGGYNIIHDFVRGQDKIILREAGVSLLSEVTQTQHNSDIILTFTGTGSTETTVVLKDAMSGGFLDVTDFDHMWTYVATDAETAIIGEPGADSIRGNDLGNTIRGLAGDDRLIGSKGDDFLIGNEGDDFLDGSEDSDILVGGDGNDTLRGGKGLNEFRFDGNDGSDTIIDFTRGDDIISVWQWTATSDSGYRSLSEVSQTVDGDDLVLGMGETEVRLTGAGAEGPLGIDDFLGLVSILGSDTGDLISGTSQRDIINGLGGNDVVDGAGGNDRIIGSTGDDILTGGAGDDFVDGSEDNDSISGGLGNDTLRGGAGNNMFVFGANDGDDTIIDFTQGDDILNVKPAGLTSFADILITDNGTDSIVSFADTTVTIENVIGLTESDFDI